MAKKFTIPPPMYDDAKHTARSADASRDTVATKCGNTSNYRANRTRVNGQYHPRMVFDITAALFVLNEEEEEDAPVSDADDDVIAVNDENLTKNWMLMLMMMAITPTMRAISHSNTNPIENESCE